MSGTCVRDLSVLCADQGKICAMRVARPTVEMTGLWLFLTAKTMRAPTPSAYPYMKVTLNFFLASSVRSFSGQLSPQIAIGRST